MRGTTRTSKHEAWPGVGRLMRASLLARLLAIALLPGALAAAGIALALGSNASPARHAPSRAALARAARLAHGPGRDLAAGRPRRVAALAPSGRPCPVSSRGCPTEGCPLEVTSSPRLHRLSSSTQCSEQPAPRPCSLDIARARAAPPAPLLRAAAMPRATARRRSQHRAISAAKAARSARSPRPPGRQEPLPAAPGPCR